MRRWDRIAVACVVISGIWVPTSGQKINDAISLLKTVRDTYDSLRSFRLEGKTVTESRSPGMQTKMELPFKGDFVMPGKMRMDTENPMGKFLVVSDGRTLWLYIAGTKTYSEIEIGQHAELTVGSEDKGGLGALAVAAAIGVPSDMFQLAIARGLRDAKILGEEDVELEGKKVACYVIKAEYDQPKEEAQVLPLIKTYWIDKGHLIVLRDTYQLQTKSAAFGQPAEMSITTTVTKIRLNEPIPDDLFVFTPPEGAQKAEPAQTSPLGPNSPP